MVQPSPYPDTEVFERAELASFKLRGGSSDPNQEMNCRESEKRVDCGDKVISQSRGHWSVQSWLIAHKRTIVSLCRGKWKLKRCAAPY